MPTAPPSVEELRQLALEATERYDLAQWDDWRTRLTLAADAREAVAQYQYALARAGVAS